jgi:signal transduction histidine kinase
VILRSDPETGAYREIAHLGAQLRHRVHNPLQVMLGEIQLLEEQGPADVEARTTSIQNIAEAARRVAGALQQFEDWAATEVAGLTPAVEPSPGAAVAVVGGGWHPAPDRLTVTLVAELSRLARSLEAAPRPEDAGVLQPRMRRAARLANLWLSQAALRPPGPPIEPASAGSRRAARAPEPFEPATAGAATAVLPEVAGAEEPPPFAETPGPTAEAPTARPAAASAALLDRLQRLERERADTRDRLETALDRIHRLETESAEVRGRLEAALGSIQQLETERAELSDRLDAAESAVEPAASRKVMEELRDAARTLTSWLEPLRAEQAGRSGWYPPLVRAAETVLRLVDEATTSSAAEPAPPAVTEPTPAAETAPPTVRPIDLLDVAREALDLALISAEARQIRTALVGPASDRPVRVKADRSHALRILETLIRNALEATPAGGAVVLTVRAGEFHGFVDIEDTGPGVPRGRVEDIFRPPPRDTHPTGRTTGLAVARGLARQMGGDIVLRNPGEVSGAVFSVSLPRPETHE